MSEPNESEGRKERAERRAGEGVRIIGPEEAQAAIDAGQAAGRRAEDELRFGDVPPAPSGPRPPHRFPLPDSVDPAAAVPRPPIAQAARGEHGVPVGKGRVVRREEAHDPRPWQERRGPVPFSGEHQSPVVAAEAGAHEPATPAGGEPAAAPGAIPLQPATGSAAGTSPGQDQTAVLPVTPAPQTSTASGSWTAPPADDEATHQHLGGQQPRLPQAAPGDAPTGTFGRDEAAGIPGSPAGPVPGWTVPGGTLPGSGPWDRDQPPARQGPTPAAEPSPWGSDAGSISGSAAGASAGTGAGSGSGRTDPPAWTWAPGDAPRSDDAGAGAVEGSHLQTASGHEHAAATPSRPTYEGPWSERPASFSYGVSDGSAGRPTSSWPPSDQSPAAAGPQLPAAAGAQLPAAAGTQLPAADRTSSRNDSNPPDEGITVTGGFGTELPHWTDPPTGEVPRILPAPADDDLAAWEALGAQGTRWRDDATGAWEHPTEFADLADEAPVGALDQSRTAHSDLYSFDEDFERLEEERSGSHQAISTDPTDDDFDDFADLDDADEPAVVGGRAPRSTGPRAARRPRRARPPGGGGGRRSDATGGGTGADLGSRLAVGAGLVVLLIIAYAVGPVAVMVLATAVVVAAAIEVYGMLQHSGFRPATLLGLVATVGLMFGAYWRGVGALPLVIGLVFVASMLWYLLGIVEARPLANVAVTLTAFAWVGVLGSFAALLLRAHHGNGLFLGAVVPAVVADIVAYFVGRRMGSRPLAPRISPTKTLEGAIGGGVAAVIVGIIIGHSVSPWGGVKHGLLLGIVVAVLAPIGDLFESMIKRDLDVKDSGSLLSGHGGVLDRFDSVLLVLPAAYYLASYFGVVR